MSGEENLPAKGAPASTPPRISASHGNQSGPQHRLLSAPARSREVVGIVVERLRQRGEFTDLARSGKRATSGLVSVRYLPAHDGRRVVGYGSHGIRRAVERNRRRRQLRALVAGLARESPGQLPAGRYLIVTRAGEATYAELGEWLGKALARATESAADR